MWRASVALRASIIKIDITKGQVVFAEGCPEDRHYALMDGIIEHCTTSNDGRKSLSTALGPGKMFGELSLFNSCTKTVTAHTEKILPGIGR